MHLPNLCIVCALAGALGIHAGAVSPPAPGLDSRLDACAVENTATVYVTVADNVSGAEIGKIDTLTLTAGDALFGATTVLAEVSDPLAPSAVSPSGSESEVVIISTITVVPIVAGPSPITSTTTLRTTVQETQFRTVTKTLESSTATGPAVSPSTGETTPVTITVTRQPSTTTITLSLVKPVQTKTHYPGWASSGWNMTSAPARISKNPATTATPSDSVILVDESTVNIYQTSHSKISFSVMLAKSGFMNNPGPSGTATLALGVATAGLPNHTPVSTSSMASSTALTTPGASSASAVHTSGTLTTAVVANPKSSSVVSSTSPSRVADTFTSSAAFSTLAPSTLVSSTVRYVSTPRYLNTTSKTITSSIASTSTLAAPSPDPNQCGEQGDFILNFDDIPPLTVNNNSTGTIQPAPVFNPYHQFDFSDGFTVAPPPTAPYLPSSGSLLLELIPSFVLGVQGIGPNTAVESYSGQISDGDHGLSGCFSFNVYGATFGCNSTGPPCDFTFSGLHYDVATGMATSVTTQTASIPACPALVDCHLAPIVLDHTFVDLNAIQIKATAAGAPLGWWMDDLQLGWFNNSCSAGLCRQFSHIH